MSKHKTGCFNTDKIGWWCHCPCVFRFFILLNSSSSLQRSEFSQPALIETVLRRQNCDFELTDRRGSFTLFTYLFSRNLHGSESCSKCKSGACVFPHELLWSSLMAKNKHPPNWSCDFMQWPLFSSLPRRPLTYVCNHWVSTQSCTHTESDCYHM